MNIKSLIPHLRNRKSKHEGIQREYAVLIPLIEVDDNYHVLFEKRASHLNSQPSDICFPGGKIEFGENSKAAAIRETCEELNLSMDQIRLIGQADMIITLTNIIIHPYIAILDNVDIGEIMYSKDEVESIFTVPLDHFITHKAEHHELGSEFVFKEDFPFSKIENGKDYKWFKPKYPVLFYHYDDKVIWGITARILNNFINIIGEI